MMKVPGRGAAQRAARLPEQRHRQRLLLQRLRRRPLRRGPQQTALGVRRPLLPGQLLVHRNERRRMGTPLRHGDARHLL